MNGLPLHIKLSETYLDQTITNKISIKNLYIIYSIIYCHIKGAVHKVCHAIFDDFLPPPPSQTVTNLGPPQKVCHTSEQKVKHISRRMETALNCLTIVVIIYFKQ